MRFFERWEVKASESFAVYRMAKRGWSRGHSILEFRFYIKLAFITSYTFHQLPSMSITTYPHADNLPRALGTGQGASLHALVPDRCPSAQCQKAGLGWCWAVERELTPELGAWVLAPAWSLSHCVTLNKSLPRSGPLFMIVAVRG